MARGSTGYLLRKLAHLGARHGPNWLLYASPPLIGFVLAACLRAQRRQVVANLERVRGPSRSLRERFDVERTFMCYARCFAEGLARGRPDAHRTRNQVFGGDQVHEILRNGSGLVVVTAHVGPWDAAAQALHDHLGVPVKMVMAPEGNARAREFHEGVRRAAEIEVLHSGGGPLASLPLLGHLERGGVVALQLDRVAPSGRHAIVPLFGQPTPIPTGPFRLAALAGVPLVPIFARWVGFRSYELHVKKPLSLPQSPSRARLLQVAEEVVSQMEGFIREAPTQWFHFAEAPAA